MATQNSKLETRNTNWSQLTSGLFLDSILNCECRFCWRKPLVAAAADKILRRIEHRLRKEEAPAPDALHILKMLARSTEPLTASKFQEYLSLDARSIKAIIKELRDEWLLPVCATRKPPYGYFIAATAEQFIEWMRVTRSQAISELATSHKVFRVNFPELAGQQVIDFIDEVSNELRGAAAPEEENAKSKGELAA